MADKHKQSVGTMISTVSFAGVSVALANEAAQAEGLRAVGLWLTAAVCLAAALRYRIAAIVEKWRSE